VNTLKKAIPWVKNGTTLRGIQAQNERFDCTQNAFNPGGDDGRHPNGAVVEIETVRFFESEITSIRITG
jgi:hypothetical protein